MITIHNARTYRGPGEYVGRPHPRFPKGSVLGNPYHVDRSGTRAGVIAKYRRWLRDQWLNGGLAKDELLRLAEIYRAAGSLDLICWCSPLPCHVTIIAQAIREIVGEAQPDLTGPIWLLVTGSREATPAMLDYARRVVIRVHERGWSIVVGDAPGIDATVIEAVDAINAGSVVIPIEVHGGHNQLRHRALTGNNIVHACSYPARDHLMADRADRCIAIWNGTSPGTRLTFEYARSLGLPVDVRTYPARGNKSKGT